MNRRKFLKWIGLGAAAVIPLPYKPAITAPISAPEPAGWVSYRFRYTVSMPPSTSNAIRYIDSTVERAAEELGYRAGQTMSDLYAAAHE